MLGPAHILRRGSLAFFYVLALTLSAAAQTSAADSSTPASAPVAGPALKVPAGERLILELQDSLHTAANHTGDHAHFQTYRETVVGYQVAIPQGSFIRGTLTKVKKPGLAGRAGAIGLRFEEITLPDGTVLPLEADLLRAGFIDIDKNKNGASVKGERGIGKRDTLTVAMGAGQGALIGASVAGKKGAIYGGAIGAGAGLAEILLRRGPHLDLPRGTFFEVELTRELVVPQASAARFAQQSVQQAAGVPSASTPPPATPSADTDDFRFPDEPDLAVSDDSIPDFPEEETATIAEARPPDTGVGAPAELPPPAAPPLPDPTLGDSDPYKLKVDVRLVTVEAIARDRDGRVLENLRREDFQIFEDGVAQQIRHFSRDELPMAVALVVDRSGSVAPFMPELRRAAYQTLSSLKRGDEVALFAFDADVERLEELATDRRRIAERIARIRAGGGTNITDALAAAAQYLALAAPDRRRAIILISDNAETVRGHTSQGRLVRLALEYEVVIYSVKTPGEPTPLTMRVPGWLGGLSSVRTITRETGGEIIDVNRVGSLEAALAAVVARLKTRYTLGYQSTNKTADGAFRRIEVRLAERFGRPEQDYSVFARSGYYAPTERRAAQQPAPTQ
jgi:VWFA-related protein